MHAGVVDAKGGVCDKDSLPDCWGAERFVLVKTMENTERWTLSQSMKRSSMLYQSQLCNDDKSLC
jgi:hypothetical protein